MNMWPFDVIKYQGRPIGWIPDHSNCITTFQELGAILDDPEATQEQKDAAQGEIEMAMDDFS